MPDTLEALILSRLDHLEEQVKRVIQCASVIGQEFRLRILRSVSEITERLQTALGSLLTAELIYEKSKIPELEYLFRNALTREVSYHTLLRRRRALYHLKVAQALEEIYPGSIEEHIELIAHHTFLGGAKEEARAHLQRAIEKCRFLDANLTALDFTEKLLVVLRERLDDTPRNRGEIGEALTDLGRLHYITGDLTASEQRYREAIAHAESNHLRQQRLIALRNIGDVLRLRGKAAEGEEAIRKAIRLCGPRDRDLRVQCRLNLGVVLMSTGRLVAARRELEHFVKWADGTAATLRQRYIASSNLGIICHHTGDLEAAQAALDRACDLAEEMGRRRELAEALLNRGRIDIDRGALREARHRLHRSLRLAEAIDHGRLTLLAKLALSEVAHHRGLLAQAADLTLALLDEARGAGMAYLDPALHLNLARVRHEQGRDEEARDQIAQAEKAAEAFGDTLMMPLILAAKGLLAASGGDLSAGRALSDEALELAESVGAKQELAEIHRTAAEVAHLAGDPAAARQRLRRAIREAQSHGLKRELAWSHLALLEVEAEHPQRKPSGDAKQLAALTAEIEDSALRRRARRLGIA